MLAEEVLRLANVPADIQDSGAGISKFQEKLAQDRPE